VSEESGTPKIASLADLYAVAYQIEADAVERYELLAAQMQVHNNPDLAALFGDLARAEGIHRDAIRRLAGEAGVDAVAHAGRVAKWSKGESPEEVDAGAAHYLMTPWHALQLALEGEQRALAFFTSVVATAKDARIRRIAEEFVEEEAEHVNLVHRQLRRHPAPTGSWPDDLDPPVPQD
jgi:rubrerythrin